MKLISPTPELVNIFNSYWTPNPITTIVKVFEDDDEIDLTKYIAQFKEYGEEDKKITEKKDLKEFLEKINSVYHTRVSEIDSLVKELKKLGIDSKDSLAKKINSGEVTLPKFVACCKAATGNYTYSFASKVFSFINAYEYPIIDSFVATLLDTYEYNDRIPRSKWGDYSKYIENYNNFKSHFGLTDLSFKVVDKFLWTYAKILLDYWADLGVLSYEPISFDTKSLEK
ncbi:MAG: hypothetical protein K5669_01290 [Lachnospiraceae bacterium]|nr:hypothetical protein [Lachnospiraceae bacterium]